MAVQLVSGVEVVVQVRVLGQHVLVEDGGDGGAMFLDHGHGGLDDVDLVFGQRHVA